MQEFVSLRNEHTRVIEALAQVVEHDEDELVLRELDREQPLAELYQVVPAAARRRRAWRGAGPIAAGQAHRCDERPCDPTWSCPAPRSDCSPSPRRRRFASTGSTRRAPRERHPGRLLTQQNRVAQRLTTLALDLSKFRADPSTSVDVVEEVGKVLGLLSRAGRRSRFGRARRIGPADDPHLRSAPRRRRPLRGANPHQPVRARRGRVPRERAARRTAHPHDEPGRGGRVDRHHRTRADEPPVARPVGRRAEHRQDDRPRRRGRARAAHQRRSRDLLQVRDGRGVSAARRIAPARPRSSVSSAAPRNPSNTSSTTPPTPRRASASTSGSTGSTRRRCSPTGRASSTTSSSPSRRRCSGTRSPVRAGGTPSRRSRRRSPSSADQLTSHNWSYYASGHRATGVEAPPQAQICVTENFGRTAPDPFSGELNAGHPRDRRVSQDGDPEGLQGGLVPGGRPGRRRTRTGS